MGYPSRQQVVARAKALGDLALLYAPATGASALEDLSGNGRDGSLVNGAALTDSGLVDGGAAVELDGSDDRVDTGWKTWTNLIPNPIFGDGVAGYSSADALTFELLQGQFPCAKIDTDGSSDGEGIQLNPDVGIEGGETYTFAALVLAPVGATLRLLLWNSDGTVGNTEKTFVGTGQPEFVTVQRTMPADATLADPRVATDGAQALTFRVFGYMLVKGEVADLGAEFSSAPAAFFPLADPVANFVGQPDNLASGEVGWHGTAHESPSDRGPFANGTGRTFVVFGRRDDDGSSARGLLSTDQIPTGPRLFLGAQSSDATAVWETDSSGDNENFANTGIGVGEPFAVALTMDEPGDEAKFYADGALIGTASETDPYNDPGTLRFGTVGGGPWEGPLGPVAVFNRVLTADEVEYLSSGWLPLAHLFSTVHVREKPPLWLAHDITAPSGRHYRWGPDEPEAANVPSGETLSTTAPGGFEQAGARLPRKPGIDYGDTQRLADWHIYGPGGQVAWQGRLNRVAKSSGDEQAISPEGGGWANHLEDDKTARMAYRDIDLGNWGEPSRDERLRLLQAGVSRVDGGQVEQGSGGSPALRLRISGPLASGARTGSLYRAVPGVGRIAYDFQGESSQAGQPSASFTLFFYVHSGPTLGTPDANSGDLYDAAKDTDSGSYTPSATGPYIHLVWGLDGTASVDADYDLDLTHLAVYGDHGLTLRGTEPDAGFYASDVLAHALRTWAPLLNFTEGPKGTIQPTGFIIPHLVFHEPTTAAEIVREALRYHVNPWFVWEDRTFYMHQWGARGRRWRARVGPSKLQQAGDDVKRLWNGVMVRYQDVDGSTRTVGPTGTGADAESALLLDSDPENPATLLGIKRYAVLDMGGVSRPDAAIEVGRRFLEESKLLDTSGSAQHVGTAIDEHGVEWPAWMIRAGDSIAYIDAAETGYRRVVRTQYAHGSRTCSVDLDAPPQAMDALLARLGASILDLGL